MEDFFLRLLTEYGYIILFIWSILEGELGLVMAGILSHTGDMNIFLAIIVAASGGFIGDQIFFYIGRFNRSFVQKKLVKHRRKFALATILLNKYGWYIIFVQRYLYGLRTIIPITIGTTKLCWKKFAIINLISAFVWASITIVISYIFGDLIIKIIKYVKHHLYFLIPIGLIIGWVILNNLNKTSQRKSRIKE